MPRFLFPCLAGENARPVEILARIPIPSGVSQAVLSTIEVASLQLDEVSLALASFHLQTGRVNTTWGCDWGVGARPELNGASAQLAAMLAAIASRVQVRPSVRELSEIWASASLGFSLGEAATPTIEPTCRSPEESAGFRRKLLAFVQSEARVLICAEADLLLVGGEIPWEGLTRISAKELSRAIQNNNLSARQPRFLVVLGRFDLLVLLDGLFEALFPSTGGVIAANALTVLRFPAGLLAAWLLMSGQFELASTWYVVGLFTDVADGATARFFHGTTEFGKRFDRAVDAVFNAVVGIGYVLGSLRDWGTDHEAYLFLALTGGVLVLSRIWVKPGSAVAKIRSGWIRCVILGFIGSHLAWKVSAPELLVRGALGFGLLCVALYEAEVIRRDVRGGRLQWFGR